MVDLQFITELMLNDVYRCWFRLQKGFFAILLKVLKVNLRALSATASPFPRWREFLCQDWYKISLLSTHIYDRPFYKEFLRQSIQKITDHTWLIWSMTLNWKFMSSQLLFIQRYKWELKKMKQRRFTCGNKLTETGRLTDLLFSIGLLINLLRNIGHIWRQKAKGTIQIFSFPSFEVERNGPWP